MPVLPSFKSHYGHQWKTVVRPRIMARAGNCCERCGKPDRVHVLTLKGGFWFDNDLKLWRGPGDAPMVLSPEDPMVNLVAPEDRGVVVWPQPRVSMGMEAEVDFLDGSKSQAKQIRPVISVAHLNHTPGDDRPENLAAWCGGCHLMWDLDQHHRTRANRKDARRPLLVQLAAVHAASV